MTNRQRLFSGLEALETDATQFTEYEEEIKTPVVKKVTFAVDKGTQWESDVAIELSEASFYDSDIEFEPAKTTYEAKEDEFASGIEKMIATILAPELLTMEGKVTILTIWSLMALCAIYGATQVEINFSQMFFIPPGSDLEKFQMFDIRYF